MSRSKIEHISNEFKEAVLLEDYSLAEKIVAKEKILLAKNLISTCKSNHPDLSFIRCVVQCAPFLLKTVLSYDNGKTCLHIAAASGNPELIGTLLLSHDIKVNCLDYDKQTPLHIACKKKSNDFVVLQLLRRSENPHAEDKNGKSPFYVACENSNLHAITQFCTTYFDPNVTLFIKDPSNPETSHKTTALDILSVKVEYDINAGNDGREALHLIRNYIHNKKEMVGEASKIVEKKLVPQVRSMIFESKDHLKDNSVSAYIKSLPAWVNLEEGMQPGLLLIYCCEQSLSSIAKSLLKFQHVYTGFITPESIQQTSKSPFYHAVVLKNVEFVTIFLDYYKFKVQEHISEINFNFRSHESHECAQEKVKFLEFYRDIILERENPKNQFNSVFVYLTNMILSNSPIFLTVIQPVLHALVWLQTYLDYFAETERVVARINSDLDLFFQNVPAYHSETLKSIHDSYMDEIVGAERNASNFGKMNRMQVESSTGNDEIEDVALILESLELAPATSSSSSRQASSSRRTTQSSSGIRKRRRAPISNAAVDSFLSQEMEGLLRVQPTPEEGVPDGA